jgi:hypothetical protein
MDAGELVGSADSESGSNEDVNGYRKSRLNGCFLSLVWYYDPVHSGLGYPPLL